MISKKAIPSLLVRASAIPLRDKDNNKVLQASVVRGLGPAVVAQVAQAAAAVDRDGSTLA